MQKKTFELFVILVMQKMIFKLFVMQKMSFKLFVMRNAENDLLIISFSNIGVMQYNYPQKRKRYFTSY